MEKKEEKQVLDILNMSMNNVFECISLTNSILEKFTGEKIEDFEYKLPKSILEYINITYNESKELMLKLYKIKQLL